MLTDEQKRTYLERHGAFCPFCRSNNIEGRKVKIDVGAWQRIECLDCEKEWHDIYTLVAIEDVPEPFALKL